MMSHNHTSDHRQQTEILGHKQEHIHGYGHDEAHGTSSDHHADVHPVFISGVTSSLLARLLFFALLFVIVLGIVGNSLILIIVAVQKRQRTISSYFVASLAMSDAMVLLTCGILHLVILAVPAFLLIEPFDFPWEVYNVFTFIHLVSPIYQTS